MIYFIQMNALLKAAPPCPAGVCLPVSVSVRLTVLPLITSLPAYVLWRLSVAFECLCKIAAQ